MAHQNLDYFPHDRVNWRLGLRHAIPGLSPPFQAYLTCFYYLVAFSLIRHIVRRKNIYSVFIVISIQQCHLVINGSLTSSLSEDTDIDIADYDLEVEGSPKSLIKKQKRSTLGRHKLQFGLFATFSWHSPP